MKKIVLLLGVSITLLFTSCATVGTPVGIGLIYSGVTNGVSATNNDLGSKVGKSSAINVFGLIATGDASIQKATNSAGITKISHVDQKRTSVLGIFATYETIVYGE